MEIKTATFEDAPGIAAVHARSWQSAYADILAPDFLSGLSIEKRTLQWRTILEKSESKTLVARSEEGVIGFISYGNCRDEGAPATQGEIWAINVAPSEWRRGTGSALLRNAIRALHQLDKTSTSLWVLSQNQAGLRFYQAIGFERAPGGDKDLELGGRKVEEVRLLLRHDA